MTKISNVIWTEYRLKLRFKGTYSFIHRYLYQARPSTSKHAQARSSMPKHAHACPSTPKHAQARPKTSWHLNNTILLIFTKRLRRRKKERKKLTIRNRSCIKHNLAKKRRKKTFGSFFLSYILYIKMALKKAFLLIDLINAGHYYED